MSDRKKIPNILDAGSLLAGERAPGHADDALHRLRDELESDRKARAALAEYLSLKEEKEDLTMDWISRIKAKEDEEVKKLFTTKEQLEAMAEAAALAKKMLQDLQKFPDLRDKGPSGIIFSPLAEAYPNAPKDVFASFVGTGCDLLYQSEDTIRVMEKYVSGMLKLHPEWKKYSKVLSQYASESL